MRIATPVVCLFACLAAATVVAAKKQPRLTDLTQASGGAMVPEQAALEFEKADLSFRVDPARRRFDGDATLTFRAKAALPALLLDLDRQLAITEVSLGGRSLPASAWSNPEGRLRILLQVPLAAGESVSVRIRYGGKPHVASRAPWDGGFVWAKAPGGEPWVATAVQGEGCDLFWPCIDHPQGEPQLVDQHITVPAPLVAAGNGVSLGMDEHDGWRTWHWRARHPNTYAIALNIGPFELLSGEYRSRFGNVLPLRFWHLQGSADKARELFAELPQYLDFFEATIGPYPFADEKVGVVETPHLGMEHQTINAYGNAYRKDAFGYDWLLHHEFSHEWFGNQLTNADWDDMWLHEGFGTYMQPLYLQRVYGDVAYFASMHANRARLLNRAPLVSGQNRTEEAVYADKAGPGSDIYFKGAWLLHALRGLVGDEAFFQATRRLVYGTAEPRPGALRPRYGSTREFIRYVNEASGRDLGWFFDAYVFQAALPELLQRREGGRLWLRWKLPGDLPFPMPVEVRVDGVDSILDMGTGEASLPLPPYASVTVDPHSKLLRAQAHIEAFQRYQDGKRTQDAASKH